MQKSTPLTTRPLDNALYFAGAQNRRKMSARLVQRDDDVQRPDETSIGVDLADAHALPPMRVAESTRLRLRLTYGFEVARSRKNEVLACFPVLASL